LAIESALLLGPQRFEAGRVGEEVDTVGPTRPASLETDRSPRGQLPELCVTPPEPGARGGVDRQWKRKPSLTGGDRWRFEHERTRSRVRLPDGIPLAVDILHRDLVRQKPDIPTHPFARVAVHDEPDPLAGSEIGRGCRSTAVKEIGAGHKAAREV